MEDRDPDQRSFGILEGITQLRNSYDPTQVHSMSQILVFVSGKLKLHQSMLKWIGKTEITRSIQDTLDELRGFFKVEFELKKR